MCKFRTCEGDVEAGEIPNLGPEAARGYKRRLAEGFFQKYLSGDKVLDIGYRGGRDNTVPITDRAIGIDLDYPGYDGIRLPFDDGSQDAVFACHCLEHIDDWQTILVDWFRVTKVSGFLVIAVPHRDLYERRAALPSRFNGGHRRFYTPQSLLAEIEAALPIAEYRIRSLKDIDDGFNYSTPPEKHASGCYEIELVIQKIAAPAYAGSLRQTPAAAEMVQSFVALLIESINAERVGCYKVAEEYGAAMKDLPLPAFREIKAILKQSDSITDDEVRAILRPIVKGVPFDEEWYLSHYKGIGDAVETGRQANGHSHYIHSGYFEGRAPTQEALLS